MLANEQSVSSCLTTGRFNSTALVLSPSFTWTSSRMDRNTITVMSGQTVDSFDSDFRELYALSDQVDLYQAFNITKPPLPTPIAKPKVAPIQPPPVSTSRFQVSVDDSRQVDLKVPAYKYHNPKYSLVVGNNRGLTRSLQDLSTMAGLDGGLTQKDGLQNGFLHPSREKLERTSPQSPGSEETDEGSKKNQTVAAKKRSSFRRFLNGRGANHATDTIEEGVVTPQSPAPPCKVPETNGVAGDELEDFFEIIVRPEPPKPKTKKPSKIIQRSISLQTINTGDQDGTVCWFSPFFSLKGAV